MKPKFKKTVLGAVIDPFYSVDIIRKEKNRWVLKDWCASCRRKTKFQLHIDKKMIDTGLWRSKYVWCCGPECMEKELEIIKLELVEAITR